MVNDDGVALDKGSHLYNGGKKRKPKGTWGVPLTFIRFQFFSRFLFLLSLFACFLFAVIEALNTFELSSWNKFEFQIRMFTV